MAWVLLKQWRMPAEFWGEAVVTAVYLQNRLPMKSLVGRTPYEAWHGRKPVVNHLRVFGCRAFVKQLGHVDKLADRSHAGVFIGYTEGASSIRRLGRCARHVTSCFMRRMAGTGLQPRARHRRQISPSNTSTPGHQERQRQLDRHRRMP
jgi:hypothetical protein